MYNTLVIVTQCSSSSREQQSALRSHELHAIPAPKEAGPNCEFLKLSYSEIKFQHVALFYQPVSCICADSHSVWILCWFILAASSFDFKPSREATVYSCVLQDIIFHPFNLPLSPATPLWVSCSDRISALIRRYQKSNFALVTNHPHC